MSREVSTLIQRLSMMAMTMMLITMTTMTTSMVSMTRTSGWTLFWRRSAWR